MQELFETPILLIIFKRPETTQQVLEAIRKVKPKRLFVAANAPKNNIGVDSEKCLETRNILNQIDWECDVKTLFREQYLDCKVSISSAINWFFKNVEQGIILEDDCVPDVSFFSFCEELLIKYKEDMRVWHIGGVSTLNEQILINQDSYYFSHFNHIWGWASWASRWKFYDVSIPLLDEFSNGKYIKNISEQKILQKFWLNNFKGVAQGEIDSWDYQWYFTTWVNGGLSIIPKVNLVSNIGFGASATHTNNDTDKLSRMEVHEISSELIHPKIIMPNKVYDEFNGKYLFGLNRFNYYWRLLKKVIKKIIKT